MKISAFFLGMVAAGKGGRGGKHGNINMDNERYNWKIPKCITSPDMCQEDSVATSHSGKVELQDFDYMNHKNTMVRIQLGEGRRLKLKFDKKAGFGMEWHNKCGYDKVHIFKGRADDFDNAKRIARFCGPKNTGGKPFDAARNLRPVNGVLPMWDEWFDVGSGDVFVAVDLDQDRNDFTGFVLEWDSEPTKAPDFSDFETAAKELHRMIKEDTLNFKLKNVNPVLTAANSLHARMLSRAAEDKNNCQLDFSGPVPDKLIQTYEGLWEQPSSTNRWDHAVYGSGQLMHHYLNDCPASRSWISAGSTGKLKHIVQKRNNNLDRS